MHNNKSTMANKRISFAGCFDGLGNPPLQYRAHPPMEDVLGYIRGHWTPPPGNYLHHIAPMATRVIGFGTHPKVVAVKMAPLKLAAIKAQNGPFTHVIDAAAL